MKNKTLISLFLLCSILLCGCWHSHDDYDFEEEMRFFPYVDNSKLKMTNEKDSTIIIVECADASIGCDKRTSIFFTSRTSKPLLKNGVDKEVGRLRLKLRFTKKELQSISLEYLDFKFRYRKNENEEILSKIDLKRDTVVFPFSGCMDLVFAKDKGLQEIRTFDGNIWTLIE
ncbi:MAG: hypothetical protein MJ069_10665 [Salinivirgaceae bacterium]|nr:hypothetical protein [Salinivirgaceae bacterium]